MMTEWQPIETAPEGVTVDLWDAGGGRITDAFYSHGFWRRIVGYDESERLSGIKPTHWMPLPEPPHR